MIDPTKYGATKINPTQYGATKVDPNTDPYGYISSKSSPVPKPKINNFLSSAFRSLINVDKGILKGAGSTIKNIGDLGEKALSQTAGRVANVFTGKGAVPTQTANQTQLGQKAEKILQPVGTAQKIGKAAEQVSEFLIPGGAASKAGKAAELATGAGKLAKAAGLGAKALTEAGTMAGVTAAQGGSGKDIKNAGLLGAAFPIVGAAAKGLGKVGTAVVEHLASTLSGVPKAAIQHAVENPVAVQKAMTRAAQDEGMSQKIYKNAVEALDDLKNARRSAYEGNLVKLEKEITYTKNGQMYVNRVLTDAEAKATKGYIPGTSIGVPTKLSTNGIKNVFTRTAKQFGAEGSGQRGLDFTNVALDDAHISKLQKLQDRIYNWTDTSPTGINKLRQVIASYETGGVNLAGSESKFNKIIGDLRRNLSDYVGERVPQVAVMNKEYRAASEVIDNIRNQLKIGSKDPNTALRKLVNVFNPKSSLYRPVVEQLGEKAGKDLMSDIAGLVMSKWTPEGIGKYLAGIIEGGSGVAAFTHPEALAAIPATMLASSPRVIGNVATKGAKLVKNKTARKVISKVGSATKGAIIKASSSN